MAEIIYKIVCMGPDGKDFQRFVIYGEINLFYWSAFLQMRSSGGWAGDGTALNTPGSPQNTKIYRLTFILYTPHSCRMYGSDLVAETSKINTFDSQMR